MMEKFNDSVGDKKQKILVVDDDEVILEIVKTMLKNEYDVSTVKSGKEALGLFFQGFIPQLILLDLLMPDMDGWDTYSKIKVISNLHYTRIAILTSSENPKDKEKAREMGAVDFIKKPVEKDDLLDRIRKLLDKRP